jgi:Na+-transporting methylmalonyl-CoA/oxaloacetate decarboxylase gamma subunit
MSTVSLALQLTAAGMGLVFATILLLWGLMVVLVRVAQAPATTREPPTAPELGMEEQAAAAAVAFALRREAAAARAAFPLPPTAFVSAWQAVRRSSQLNQRGPVR